MYCKNCGKEINDNADVCIHCGKYTRENSQVVYSTKPTVIQSEEKITFISLCALTLVATFLMPTLAYATSEMEYSRYGIVSKSYEEYYSLFEPLVISIRLIALGIAVLAAVFIVQNKKSVGTVLYSVFVLIAFIIMYSNDYWIISPAIHMVKLLLLLSEGSLFLGSVFNKGDERKRSTVMICLVGIGIILCLVGFMASKTLQTDAFWSN